MPADTVALTTPVVALIASVRDVVLRRLPPAATAAAAGGCLAASLSRGLALPERCRRGDPQCYRQHLLHTEPDGCFSIVALVWLPGQHTEIHDHVSWCVTGVCEGQEHEERFSLRGDGSCLVPAGQDINTVGAVSALAPPGDIHRVSNCGDSLTISLHIYGADIAALGSSIRRVYPQPVAHG